MPSVNLEDIRIEHVFGRPSGLVALFVRPEAGERLIAALGATRLRRPRLGAGGRSPPNRLGPVRSPVIAVDGPAGSGKSSVCRGAAERLGLRYLDTGRCTGR